MARYQVQSKSKPICSEYIADGFADDCDELIHRCSQVKTLSYEKFCDVWKEMEFSCVFHCRNLCTELAELSEELLHVAKHYMVANTDNYEESVAGLFLVYGILNLQPIPKFASLRLIPEDVPAIKKIESVARKTRRLDVLYILGSVLISGTHYHVVQREKGMEYPIRKYLEGYTTIDKQGIRPKGVFYRQNEELDILRDLNRLGKSYKEAKEAIVGPSNSERNLNYLDENMPRELEVSLKNVITGVIYNRYEKPAGLESASSEAEPSTVQAIKEKAMKMPVQGMAHLRAISDDIPKGRKRQKPKSKRKGRTKRGKRRKRDISSDSDTTDDELILSEEDELDDEENDDIQDRLKNTDVCEIEIIDEFKDKETNPLISMLVDQMKLPELDAENTDSENIGEIKDALQKRDVMMTKVGTSGECEASTSKVSNVAGVEVVPEPVFKKPTKLLEMRDKRDLKKAFIKTKFQRMGMLPVANFDESKDNKK